MTVRRIERNLVTAGNILDYCVDTMDLGEGRTAQWDLIHHHSGAAAVVPVDDQGRILLVRQWRNAPDRFTWEIPAGKLDPGEESRVCALRELREETGYAAGRLTELFSIFPTVAYLDEKIRLFLAEDLTYVGENPDPGEELVLRAFTVEELLDMIFGGQIEDAKTVAGVLAWQYRRGRSSR